LAKVGTQLNETLVKQWSDLAVCVAQWLSG